MVSHVCPGRRSPNKFSRINTYAAELWISQMPVKKYEYEWMLVKINIVVCSNKTGAVSIQGRPLQAWSRIRPWRCKLGVSAAPWHGVKPMLAGIRTTPLKFRSSVACESSPCLWRLRRRRWSAQLRGNQAHTHKDEDGAAGSSRPRL